MSSISLSEKIGTAWRMHRDGDHAGAISMFEEIASSNPDIVDAYYGLGLAQKAVGDYQAATDAFQQALSITEDALKAVQMASSAEGHQGGNDLESNDDDRYMMLTRMLKQRLEDVSTPIS